MRTVQNINKDWDFYYSKDNTVTHLDLPHTWNGDDGQDGGDDYYRGTCKYEHHFARPALKKDELLYIEFKGVNSSAKVYLNGTLIVTHEGGYSTFRGNLTDALQDENNLTVEVDNSKNDRVYPQFADFTFYGGIYRDVNLITVNKDHFDLDYFGTNPIKVDCKVNGDDAEVTVQAYTKSSLPVKIKIMDAENKVVCTAENGKPVKIAKVHLWNGTIDPYLYKAVAKLGSDVDEISTTFGVRTFAVDPKKGFFLNGKPYHLHGVCRHQDRPHIGNALTKKEHEEDMALIMEVGSTTLRLAHYQHDDYFYDLCDKNGLVVWAEIPYISKHMENGKENARQQMKELILQQYNHPCIVTWGLSNEITMKKTNNKDMIQAHKDLNKMVHELDLNRVTTLACFAMCGPFNKVAHISDIVSWNLYLGWYAPGFFLNDLFIGFYHLMYPKSCLGYSEYGAEGMPNLHAAKPKRFDNTEEYQAIYHEKLLKVFQRHPYMWATHLWNMFDFAADGRNQGGEPGMNHKGLITFNRQLKKDAFFIYKASWSKEPVFHLCGTRYINRNEKKTTIKVYSNLGQPVEVYNNGQLVKTMDSKDKIYQTKIVLNEGANEIVVKSAGHEEKMTLNKVDKKDESYVVHSGNSMSWEKK